MIAVLAQGNSGLAACARNLLAMAQREVPFARSKGIDPDVFDMPFDEAEGYLDETARDVLGAYEPRIDVEEVELAFGEDGDAGGATYTVEVVQSDLDEDSDDYWEDDD